MWNIMINTIDGKLMNDVIEFDVFKLLAQLWLWKYVYITEHHIYISETSTI